MVEQLASIQCTDEEIAAVLGVSVDTLIRRKKEPAYQEALDGGKAKGRASLRRMQWQAAKNGSVPMMIFLGKNLLGQRDKVEDATTDDVLDKARQIRDAIKAMAEVETGQEAVN